MSERREGWYHVKIEGVWGCCEYDGFDWIVLNNSVEDKFFDEIGPRIPSPDEPWQCVPKKPTPEMYLKMRRNKKPGIEFEALTAWDDALKVAPSPDDQDA